MTINLTELRDDPLGKHPIQAAVCTGLCFVALTEAQQDVVAADDDESSFTFDVDGLSDEALDPRPSVSAALCVDVPITCFSDGLGDEPLDPRPAVNAAVGCVCVFVCLTPVVDASRVTQGRRA